MQTSTTAHQEKQTPLPHRIAAGAIVVNRGKVLLVRYADAHGGGLLVSPGGGVEENEGLAEAAIRETREETGVTVAAERLLAVEHLIGARYMMCKLWFLCAYVSGEARVTEAAAKEGITQVAWFSREDLAREMFFPSILSTNDWPAFESPEWVVEAMDIREMNV